MYVCTYMYHHLNKLKLKFSRKTWDKLYALPFNANSKMQVVKDIIVGATFEWGDNVTQNAWKLSVYNDFHELRKDISAKFRKLQVIRIRIKLILIITRRA